MNKSYARTFCIAPLDILRKMYYNIFTVKGREAIEKGGGRMTCNEWKKLTQEQNQKHFEKCKKEAATCSNK